MHIVEDGCSKIDCPLVTRKSAKAEPWPNLIPDCVADSLMMCHFASPLK